MGFAEPHLSHFMDPVGQLFVKLKVIGDCILPVILDIVVS